jgi:uncharacterized protein (DUF342 family)
MTVTAAYGGKNPDERALLAKVRQASIINGIGKKRISILAQQLAQAKPGDTFEQIIAKGLPPKHGKSSKLLPLVPNALERILAPQENKNGKVDMRNFGEIICVKAGQSVMRRKPPTPGRQGKTVRGILLDAKPGEWKNFKLGEGLEISDQDENLILAQIVGMPKFQDDNIWIDDVFTCTGVNIATGNVNYDGAVVVNGDVTEKMRIVATGDITVNGFIESADLKAGGDIIITEGAMGKVNELGTEYSCKLEARGGIHIQHGQGLDIVCGGELTIGRQLTYSRVRSSRGVTVGPIDNPNGNLFACDIYAQTTVIAGTLGAISGSQLNIDFSDGFNAILGKKDTLDELLQNVKEHSVRHKNKIELINTKAIPVELRGRYDKVVSLFADEMESLNWLKEKIEQLREERNHYQLEMKLVANKRLYPGVSAKINNKSWRADREYQKSLVQFKHNQWRHSAGV